MISFKSAMLALALVSCALSTCSAGDSIRARRLSFPLIAGYEPQSLVTDHNALDLDVALMEKQLASGAWSEAHHIYKDGGYTKSYADLNLTTPLRKKVPMDRQVQGTSNSGGIAKGRTLSEAAKGERILQVQYQVNSIQDSYVDCQVGALWRVHEAKLDGCFKEGVGSVEIEGHGAYNYTYDIRKSNHAGRTLRMLSSLADAEMMRCDGCPYPAFEKFYEYYGQADYGDSWITAAFDGKATAFKSGNADFSKATNESRIEGIQKGVVNLNIWMTVIRKMEDAIVECKKGSGRPNILSWDEAVAFYTGSKEGTDGAATGKLLHELADERCANFHTCGADADKPSGHSKVNHEIFQQFKFGQRSLLAGDCDQVRLSKELIESRMYIPMIQGTLRYAHIQSNPDTANPKAAAEGATFAAAVLPIVHSCNPQAAEVIYENTNLQASSTSFSHVKDAFEGVYNCMGITCEDVGGYYDSAAGEYFEGATPCTSTTTSSSSGGGNAIGVAFGVIIAVLVVLAGALFVARRRRMIETKPPKKNPVFVTPEEPFT